MLLEHKGRVRHGFLFFCLLLFYIIATSKVILGWVPNCDSVHLWQVYSADPLGNQATSTMTQFPTQSNYPDTEPTSPCPIVIMLST